MEKILFDVFDEDGNKYKIEEFDRLVNGGLISKLKEEKFVGKIDPDKLFITRDDFGNCFYYRDKDGDTRTIDIESNFKMFIDYLGEGKAYPSYELSEWIPYSNILSPRLNRFILYCTIAFTSRPSVEGCINYIYLVYDGDGKYTVCKASDDKCTPKCFVISFPAHQEDVAGIINKFNDGWY